MQLFQSSRNKKNKIFGKLRAYQLAAIATLIVLSLSYYAFFLNFKKDFSLKENILFQIKVGDSEYKVFQNLYNQEVIRNPIFSYYLYRLYKKFSSDVNFTSGEYQIKTSDNLFHLLKKFQENDVYYHKITFAEGLSSKQIINILVENEYLAGEIPYIPPEGSLFPDTYYFDKGTNRLEIISRMQKKMTETLAELWENRDKTIKINNKLEGLVLASIIEKETGSNEERENVSSVFHNRLDINMRLQSDPTVTYGITDGEYNLDRPLSKADLRHPTPYNTYVIYGLPLTPISNPGYASIKAALNPAKTNYFYFVSDGSNNHKFSNTLSEHNIHVQKLREIEKRRRKDEQN